MRPRILVTCSRTYSEWSTVRRVLGEIHDRYPDAILVHGDAPQGDRQVAGIWESLGGTTEPHPADWKAFGRAAGFRRNAAMVESGPAMTLAFIRNSSAGASHTADLSEGAGIPTVRYVQEDHPIEGRHADQLTPGTAVRSYPYSNDSEEAYAVDIETPEYYGSGWDRVPASDVVWSEAAPEWDLYFWIVSMPGVPAGRHSWQQATPPSLRFYKGRSWTQMLSGSRSLETDYGITPNSPPDEIAALGQRLAAAAVADKSGFWQGWVAKRDEPSVVRIGHEHYVNRGHAPSRYNGFGGSRFRIRFHDGRRVETHDLWHQGTIPPALREDLPDNAEFAKDDEVWP